MKYVALLSGGKDSCFNLLHCQKNGHELVAAASLRPEQGTDELDSYMYQTVGQDAIELVADALGVPLYRRVIAGGAVHQGSEYGGRAAVDSGGVKGDETEDMYELLATILAHHPDVKGVSVGAILSNYQRVRVEHVCRRLGLTPLCYLWQRDQGELLSEMIAAGLTAVLIKVAGIGLTTKHLGKTLAEMQPTFLKLNSLYGSHICGEGGEYETLTIDCPMFKSQIVLSEVETVIHSDSDFATIAYLRVKRAELEPKDAISSIDVTTPPLLEGDFASVEEAIASFEPQPVEIKASIPRQSVDFVSTRSLKLGDWVAVTNVQRDLAGASSETEISIQEEVSECFHKLEEQLNSHGLQLLHCANINIFLSSIDLFADVNAVYARFFGSSPPARACVAVALPPSLRVRLDAIAYAEHNAGDRQALHVQGLSYWAPANIGPYSQAILAGEQAFISGQIGLIPSTLSLADTLPLQTALSCQHAARVVKALSANTGSNWDGHPQLVIYWFDNIDQCYQAKPVSTHLQESEVPSLFVVVEALPKGAKVEKQISVHTGRFKVEDEDGDISLEQRKPSYRNYDVCRSQTSTIRLEASEFVDSTSTYVLFGSGDCPDEDLASKLAFTFQRAISAKLFYLPSRVSSIPNALAGAHTTIPLTQIPCKYISSLKENDWDYAICIFCPP